MKKYILSFLLAFSFSCVYAKPKVWIYTDMSDRNIKGTNKEGTVNDPDDISAMAAYLMLANRFDTRGVVVTSTHRKEHKTSPDQAAWAAEYFGKAYAADIKRLNKKIGGYQKTIPFMQSALKKTMIRFNPSTKYRDLSAFDTVEALIKELEKNPTEEMNVLCWGALTEPAVFVKHCLDSNKADLLRRVNFISHWSNSTLHQGTPEHPEHVANCRDDSKACAYLKDVARRGIIRFYECGAIGQHGAVSGGYKGMDYFSQFNKSNLGRIFVEGKFAYNGVDFSDAATYIVLLGDWGVSLNDIDPNGTNPTEVEKANEKTLRESAKKLHDDLLEISNQAAK